jgi:hypothetical protein
MSNELLRNLTTKAQRHKDMKVFEPLSAEVESVGKMIVDAALKVHRTLGPGLLESVYELCLAHELRRRSVRLESRVKLPIVTKV